MIEETRASLNINQIIYCRTDLAVKEMEANNQDEFGDSRSEGGQTNASERHRREFRRSHAYNVGQGFPQPLREKLIEGHYLTYDEVRHIVYKMGVGCSLENISKLSKSTMDSIKQVEFVDPKRIDKEASTLQVGRALYEFCVNMIIPCGDVLVTVVKYNFDVNSEIEKLSDQKRALTNAIIQKKQSSAAVLCPDLGVHTARIELAVGKQEVVLYNRFHGVFKARVSTMQQVQSTTPVQRTRSTSREQLGLQQQAQQQQPQAQQQPQPTDEVPMPSAERDNWEQSLEYGHYKAELKTAEKKIRLEHLEVFMAQQDSWEKYESTKGVIDVEIMSLEEERSNLQALELLFQEMRNQLSTIVQKVKNAASSHSFIRDKLSSQIVVNNENISQPWSHNNLCGIFYLLHREYSTATFELFCTFLMDLLSLSATPDELARNPYIVAQRTDAKLKMWLDFKFDSFMTRDHLFTIANLKTLQGDVQKDALTRVLEKAQQLDAGGDAGNDTVLEYTGMPLYSALVRYEKTLSETSTFPSGQRGKSGNMKSNQSGSELQRGVYEQAAAVSDTPVKMTQRQSSPDGPYTSEVTRDHGLWSPNGFPYVALKSPCPDCQARNGVHKRPQCYGSQCTACGYFGHKYTECKHIPRPDFKKGGGAKRS